MMSIPSLFSKILFCFFLNMAMVTAVMLSFFVFRFQMDLSAVFGYRASERLRTAGMLISHDLNKTPPKNWPDILARHARIHQVNFVLILKDGSRYASKEIELPVAVEKMIKDVFPPPGGFPLSPLSGGMPFSATTDVPLFPKAALFEIADFSGPNQRLLESKSYVSYDAQKRRFRRIFRTPDPTRYWAGNFISIFSGADHRMVPGVLLAVSDSITGNSFFFDPFPWMIIVALVIFISAMFWIPMVRSITKPLGRMTRAAEEIARGKFDSYIDESRIDEIGKLANAINRMTLRLSGFVKGHKRFLGDVAHELGSPIARIQIGLGILEQRLSLQNNRDLIDVIEDVAHMSRLVNELLSFSKAEINAANVKIGNFFLLPMVQSVLRRENISSVEIVIAIDPGFQVVADEELLARALANLIRNAVLYAGDAGPIEICAHRKGHAACIEVRDTGPGVPDEFLCRLFEPFSRPEPLQDRESGGVGLGLAIVKTCTEACNGTVSAKNVLPRGFVVTITMAR